MQHIILANGRAVPDLTKIATVYKTTLRTIRLKVNRTGVMENDPILQTVTNTQDVCEILRAIFATLDDDQEHFILLVLNVANEMVGFKLIASGGQDQAIVDTKVVYRNALLLGARHIMVAHNHPSGKTTPSTADKILTAKLVEAGQILDIGCLDHFIYTDRGCVSMRESNPDLF